MRIQCALKEKIVLKMVSSEKKRLKSVMLIVSEIGMYYSPFLRKYCNDSWRRQLNYLSTREMVKELRDKIFKYCSIRTLRRLYRRRVFKKSLLALRCAVDTIDRMNLPSIAYVEQMVRERRYLDGE